MNESESGGGGGSRCRPASHLAEQTAQKIAALVNQQPFADIESYAVERILDAAFEEVRTSASDRLSVPPVPELLSPGESVNGGVTHPPDNTSQADLADLRSRGLALVQQWREQADAIDGNAPGIAPMGTYALRLAQVQTLRACADALTAALKDES